MSLRIPPSTPRRVPDGTLLKADSPERHQVYMVAGGARVHIPDLPTFEAMSLRVEDIQVVAPDVVDALPEIRLVHGARLPLPLHHPASLPEGPRLFKTWVDAQLEHVPATRAVHEGLKLALTSEDAPETVKALFDTAYDLAKDALSDLPIIDATARGHVARMVAWTALAGFALTSSAHNHHRFPPYLQDGRPHDGGHDKTSHLIAQGYFAYTVLFDRTYGTGEIGDAFVRAARSGDEDEHKSGSVALAYHQLRGRVGSFSRAGVPPPAESDPPYMPEPTDLSPLEREAHDYAVRLGDAYEAKEIDAGDFVTSPEQRLGFADALAPVENHLHHLSGHRDPASIRDLTANRVGAWYAVEVFRSPDAPPHIPYDEGVRWLGRPFAEVADQSPLDYAEAELSLLARSHLIHDASVVDYDSFIARYRALFTALLDNDPAAAHRLHAGLVMRQLAYGLGDIGNTRTFQDHVDDAAALSPAALLEEVEDRLRRMEAVLANADHTLTLEFPDRSVLVQEGSHAAYLVIDGRPLWIPFVECLQEMGLAGISPTVVPAGTLDRVPARPRDGLRIRAAGSDEVFVMRGGRRVPVDDAHGAHVLAEHMVNTYPLAERPA